MNNSLISVIIPAYNVENYIKDCLNSILNQSYSNIEVIIVDDGSKDNTPGIIDELKQTDNRIKIFHKENGGASSARNLGIENASGKYLMFVDGDDIIEPDSIEILYNRLLDSDSDISEGMFYSFVSIDRKNASMFNKRWPSGNIISSKKAFECILQFRMNSSSCGKLYKKDIIDNIYFPVGQTFNEDFHFLSVLYKKDLKICLVRELVYGYRVNPSSVTHIFNERKFELLKYIEELKKQITIEDKRLYKALEVYENVINANLFISMKQNGMGKQYPVEYRRVKDHVRKNWYSYVIGRHYTLKDRVKMLFAFI